MTEPLAEAELQQAAATGAAAAVGEVADKQRVEAEAEAAKLAAQTSAEIAETAAMASTMAADSAQAAITEAAQSREVAETAVQQAGSVHDEVTSLRSEFAEQLGQLTQSVRSLLTLNQEKGETNQVTSVHVDGDKPEPQSEKTSGETAQGSGTADGQSERRRRHKFGRRLYSRTRGGRTAC
jgi:flagellar biosynthesis component FlhA